MSMYRYRMSHMEFRKIKCVLLAAVHFDIRDKKLFSECFKRSPLPIFQILRLSFEQLKKKLFQKSKCTHFFSINQKEKV